jgi:antitoxin component YwqK of YwqJK toxin-antitoxin module
MAAEIKQLDLHPDQVSLRNLRNNNNANYEKINENFGLIDFKINYPEINNNSMVPSYGTDGKLTKIEEISGSEVLSSSVLAYNPNGSLNTITKTINGRTVITTINYDANGKFLGTTNQVG